MPRAADSPSIPWWRSTRSSRSGRKTSTPSMRITRRAGSDIAPWPTRQAPTASAAAAPMAMAVSVMPRASVLVPSTHMVEWKSVWAFSSRRRARDVDWPKAFSVASPCTESRNSAPKAL